MLRYSFLKEVQLQGWQVLERKPRLRDRTWGETFQSQEAPTFKLTTLW